MQVGAAITGAPADANDAGLASFDDTMFTVDANGFVQLAGVGLAVDSLLVDAFTAPGTQPVVPDGAGQITIAGSVVAAQSVPVRSHSTAANSVTLEVQVASTVPAVPGNKNAAGLVQPNSAQFSVDADGYMTLIGGSLAIDSQSGDDGVVIFPAATGNFGWQGLTVANATHTKPVYFKDSAIANTIDLDVQLGVAVAATPGDSNDAGLLCVNDAQFTVDATSGMASLVGGANLPAIQTLTSDDPTIVGPDASGNIDITGEAVANATNAKPVFVDAGANALNVEVQVAAAITGAPGDKLDAGLSSYDDSAFTVDADGYVQLANPYGPQLGAWNLGLFYAAGTATIKGADGNDLSATNPGYVTIRSNVTEGVIITYTMTANFTFDDAAGAASVFAGSLFGMTTGDTTTTDRQTPFYLYAMADDTDANLSFFCCRYPGQNTASTTSPGNLYDAAAGTAATYRSPMSLEVLGVSLADYSGNQATMIGSFTMLINGADDWVIQPLGSVTGIGKYLGNGNLVHSKGIMGQAANSYFLANGGTAPTDTTANNNQFQYRLDQNQNILHIWLDTTFQGSPASAVDAIINMPLMGPSSGFLEALDGTLIVGGNYHAVKLRKVGTTLNTTSRQFYIYKADGTTARWQYDEWANGDRLILVDSLILR